MATFFTDPFTAANDTLLTAYTFDRVYPQGSIAPALEAIVHTNKGIGGSSGSEKIYRTTYGTDGQRDHRVGCTLDWSNAAGASRKGGIGARISNDGQSGYFAVIDSAVGAPVLHVYRRVGGVMTDLPGSPVSLGPLGPADLNAGITPEMRIQTKDAAVHVKVTVGATVFYDLDDDSADRIESWGLPGIYFGSTCVATDITFDDLFAEDFEDEADSGTGWQSGLALKVDGVYYAEYEWRALKLDPIRAKQSYQPVGAVGLIEDLNDAHEPALSAGMRVAILYDGDVLCDGVLRKVDQNFQPPEGTVYEILGPRDLAAEVPVEDPTTLQGILGWNQEEDGELYDASRQDKETGEMLAEVWDNAADGEDGLRIRGAAPASGALYDPAETALLDAKIPHVVASGNVLQAEETLISLMPDFAIFVDPETKTREIHKRSVAPFKGVDFAADFHKLPVITTNPNLNRTVVIVRGAFREMSEEEFVWDSANPDDPSGLQRGWQTSLQATIAENKRFIKEHGTTVVGVGVDAGYPYVDLDTTGNFTMDADQWRGAFIRFDSGPQQGQTYQVKSNTASRVRITSLAWVGGTPPNVGDSTILLSGEDNGGLPSGYDDVGAAWELPDDKRIAGGLVGGCGQAQIKKRQGQNVVTYTVKVRKQTYVDPDTGATKERLKMDRAAMSILDGYFANIPISGSCGTGGDLGMADEVSITLSVYDPAVASVPKIRKPASGWEGTAFSFDSSRWGTGKGPAKGDVGVMAPYIIEDGNFTDTALQGAEYEKYAQSVLNVLGTLARQAEFALAGIDTSYAGLNKRIQFSDSSGRTTGFEAATDIWLFQVEWDFKNDETHVSCGTQVAGDVRIDAFRQRYVEKTRLDAFKAIKRKMEEALACQRDGGFGNVGADGPFITPACRVGSDQPGKSLKDRLGDSAFQGECAVPVFTPTCVDFPCHTVGDGPPADQSGDDPNAYTQAQLLQNSSEMAALANEADPNLTDVICKIAKNISALWAFILDVASSHDQELHKVFLDLGGRGATSVRVETVGLKDCVNQKIDLLDAEIFKVNSRVNCLLNWIINTMIPTYAACFATKVDGAGDPCAPVDPNCPDDYDAVNGDCTWNFTETVCDPPACVAKMPFVTPP